VLIFACESDIYSGMDREKIRKFIDGRKGLIDRISEACKDSEGIVWVHSPSFGEFEESRPVIETLKKERPETKVLLTFFSPSGYEHFKNYQYADWVFYLPLDTKRNARRFLDAVRPSKVIISVSDYWLNFLAEIRRRKIDHYIVSVHMVPEYSYFKWYAFPWRKAFRGFTSMIVKDQSTADLLAGVGVKNVQVIGDPRLDRVLSVKDEEWSDPIVDKWVSNGGKVFVAGSTLNDQDDEMMIALANAHPEDKFLIIPHEIDMDEARHIADSVKQKAAIYTEWSDADADAQVLIVNKIGMLAKLYRYGFASYVGSGFSGYSPHSVIEPACYGMPVAFGPIYDHNAHCVALVEAGAGFAFADFESFDNWYCRLKSDSDYLADVSKIALDYCEAGRGASERILSIIF